MSQYQNILVAVDIYSDHKAVLAKAESLASGPQHLNLVYVTLPHMYFESYGYALGMDIVSDNQHNAKTALQALAKKHGIAEDRVYAPIGSPADEIHKLVESLNIDLIVMGTHGRSGLKLLLGSTANGVLHGVKCDVLAIKV